MRIFLFTIVALATTTQALGHPGRLAADGCHNDRKNGGRHCHRDSDYSDKTDTAKPFYSAPPAAGRSPTRAFRNCSEARAAGAAPVYAGDPGYGAHLDRDGDGIGCE